MNPLRVRALLRDATQDGITLWVEDNPVSWKSHTINVVDTGKAMSGALKYAPAEYRKETLERFKQRLLQCMRQLLDDPARSVGEATAQ